MEAPLALAFTAGLVAIVNPCGFALLPAYLSFFMGMDDRRETPPVAIAKGLVVGGVVSSGFLAVFGLTGVLVTVGLRPVITFVPWAALIVGAAVALLGVAMLAGWQPLVGLPKLEAGGGSRRHRSVFVFGVGYAVASLSCTLPIFLAVVAGSLVQTSIVGGLATFLAYGAGMSLMLLGISVALAVGRRSIVARLRGASCHLGRASGVILIVAGAYIVFFWVSNLARELPTASDPVAFVERTSSRVTQLVGGAPALWGAGLAATVLGAVAYALLSSRRRESAPAATPEPAVSRRSEG